MHYDTGRARPDICHVHEKEEGAREPIGVSNDADGSPRYCLMSGRPWFDGGANEADASLTMGDHMSVPTKFFNFIARLPHLISVSN